jgi:hypothetical protein
MKKLDCPPNGVKFSGKLHPEGAQLSLLAAALNYAQKGWPVLPLHNATHGICSCRKGRRCSHPGKHPRTPHGVKDATCSPATIRGWWKKYPEANIGLAMGNASGLIALDIDGEEGRASLQTLTKQHGSLPPTLRARTGGSGEHIYFRAQGAPIPNRVRFAKGLDTRSEGGYVVAPPSLHASGASYTWLSSPTTEPAELPQWLLELITTPKSSPPALPGSQNAQTTHTAKAARGPKNYWQKALEGEAQAVASAQEGERTNRLRDAALKLGSLITRGEPGDPQESDIPDITATLLDAAHRNGSTQKYDQAALLRTIERGLAKGKSSPRPPRPHGPTKPGQSRPALPAPKATQKPVEVEQEEETPPLVEELNQLYAVASLGPRTVIVRTRYDPTRSRQVLEYLSKQDLELLYANRRVELSPVRTISAATYWLRHPQRRTYGQVLFAPGLKLEGDLNLWQGFATEPKPGDWSLLKHHIFETICSSNQGEFNYLMALMADSVQNLSEKPGVVLVLRGKEGTGKGAFLRWWKALFGQHGLQISHPRHLTGNFNGHLHDCLFLYVDEGFWAGDHSGAGVLKNLITEPEIVIERKGRDAFSTKNHIRLVMSSNEDWVVPAGPEARRYFVLDVADQHRNDFPYFEAIERQMKNGGLSAMLHDLLAYPLEGTNLRAVPQTKGLLEQKLLSLSPVPRFWYGRLLDAELAPGRDWTEWVPTREIYAAYLEETKNAGDRRRSVETTFHKELKTLCPELEKKKRTVALRARTSSGTEERWEERLWCFRFPSLEVCRQAFETALGQPLPWPSDDLPS